MNDIQDTVIVIDYIGEIDNGNSIETKNGGIPCRGQTVAGGMVYSDREVTVEFWQGVNEKTGNYEHRHKRDFTVAAGTAEAREFVIHSKYCKVKIINNSGDTANIEAFFCMRSYE